MNRSSGVAATQRSYRSSNQTLHLLRYRVVVGVWNTDPSGGLVAFCGCQNSSLGITVLLSWYFQSPSALSTMIGHPLRCNPPVDLLSALFSVSGTLAFKILTAVPVTYGLALQKFMLYVILPMRMILRHFLQSLTLMLRLPLLAHVSTQWVWHK